MFTSYHLVWKFGIINENKVPVAKRVAYVLRVRITSLIRIKSNDCQISVFHLD